MPTPPFLAKYPNTIGDSSQVSYPTGFTDTIGYSLGATAEIVGGLSPKTYTGKLMQAPGTSNPICWTRGSLQTMGYIASLPTKGAVSELQNYGIGYTSDAYYWDAPKAWGNPGFLPRLPNTVILALLDDGTIQGQVTQNINYFNAKNISVILVFPVGGPGNPNTSPYAQSAPWIGIPLSGASWGQSGTGSGSTITIGSLTPMGSNQYVAGKVFVASSSTFGQGLQGYVAAFTSGPTYSSGVTGTTLFNAGNNTGDPNQGGSVSLYIYDARIASDLTTISNTVTGPNWVGYVNNFYWSTDNVNPGNAPDYLTQYLPPQSPLSLYQNAAVPLNKIFGGPYFNAKQLPGFSGSVTRLQLWDAIFADIQAFFGV